MHNDANGLNRIALRQQPHVTPSRQIDSNVAVLNNHRLVRPSCASPRQPSVVGLISILRCLALVRVHLRWKGRFRASRWKFFVTTTTHPPTYAHNELPLTYSPHPQTHNNTWTTIVYLNVNMSPNMKQHIKQHVNKNVNLPMRNPKQPPFLSPLPIFRPLLSSSQKKFEHGLPHEPANMTSSHLFSGIDSSLPHPQRRLHSSLPPTRTQWVFVRNEFFCVTYGFVLRRDASHQKVTAFGLDRSSVMQRLDTVQ